MRIDLHTHVKLAKKTVFSHAYFKEMMAEAGKNGLDAVAMTEHFNTWRYEDIYEVLDRHYPYEQGYYLAEGMKVFPGIGAYQIEILPCLHAKVKSANVIKALLEKELAVSEENSGDLRELGEMA
ncbi:hypothetical protein QNH46_03365 [Paenibacillus woosongensis]|uniref:PHP domain-containing protein n=1 Tax=Paenibacillus woosongensis TaxID=307580 RepID=A0AA95L230_9BACL|nr:hypothetical protein [Paenibacillus woosongensis]WHX49736.1 hypothetical protein QNH46_03365 [Paenibacillus woosongensis]